MGIHLDPKTVFEKNAKLQGVRKNGVLINEGQNKSKETIRQRRDENQKE
jgi:hypothetical protein